MIERFMALFERLVVATERIASGPFLGLPSATTEARATEEKQKRTRKPKTEDPVQVQVTGQEFFNAPLGSVPPPVQEQSAPAQERPAPVPPATGVTEGIPTGVVERRNVSAALITVAKSQELGPTKAFEVLSRYGAKEVGNLKDGDYRNVVLDCAKLLGITPQQALALDPTKS